MTTSGFHKHGVARFSGFRAGSAFTMRVFDLALVDNASSLPQSMALQSHASVASDSSDMDNFHGRGMSAEVLASLRPPLAQRPLRSVDLNYNELWDKGIRPVVDAVRSSKSLSTVLLACNSIGPLGSCRTRAVGVADASAVIVAVDCR
jgi:hypothetical protein